MANPFEAMNDDELNELVARLTYHADCKLSRLKWRGMSLKSKGAAPGGVGPEDLAAQAIVDVIDGTRAWDPEKDPDLLKYLKGVIDSLVSNLVNRKENKTTRRLDGRDGSLDESEECHLPDSAPCPYDVVADRESMDFFRAAVVAAIKDDPLAVSLFECLEAEMTKPSEIAELLGTDVSEIYNAQKRLKNKVTKVMNQRPSKENRKNERTRKI